MRFCLPTALLDGEFASLLERGLRSAEQLPRSMNENA